MKWLHYQLPYLHLKEKQFKSQNETVRCEQDPMFVQISQTKTYPTAALHPETNMHISIILTAAHTHTHTPPAARSESVILTVQSNSSILYRLTIWFMALVFSSGLGCEKKRTSQLLPLMALFHFHNSAVVLEWHLLFSIGLSMFHVDDGSVRKARFQKTVMCWQQKHRLFNVSSFIRYPEDGCMFSGCEKRVAHKYNPLKQNMWPPDFNLSSLILWCRIRGKRTPLLLISLVWEKN